MLKGIPAILSPELLKVLMEMGHGDEITIGDGNYPAASTARNLIRLDGHGVCEILDAILTFFPLDTYVDEPVLLMEKTPGDPRTPPSGTNTRPSSKSISRARRWAFWSASPSMTAPTSPTPSSPPARPPSTPTSSSKRASSSSELSPAFPRLNVIRLRRAWSKKERVFS